MESKRQQKFAKLIQKELAEVFQRECSHLFTGAFVSVSVVRVSPDLGVAKVYLSMLVGANAKELLQQVKLNTKTIRHLLAQRIKKQVRVIPELIFYLDDTAEYAARMEELFSGLEIPPADQEETSETNDEEK
ncbi:30S ribosome-binding factor RbfA [Adhaeribacter swui]|uniref:Ribosome-binding factor A n=1 Tax=Adhaeribacter swui TaxID=2086471 RepID=A0A7G7G621_9BACT|nr:30S ribosome-binding factor RbfA [Adhaeribacter swui]QNF32605.1 30S ribosome-binding factor RbfA [Adhaeribacter swui]